MGLFDRFRAKSSDAQERQNDAFYLDVDEAQTVGDMAYLKSSNTIRRTFPKSVNNPDGGELVKDVGAMDSKVTKATGALPEVETMAGQQATPVAVTAPNSRTATVTKTFAQQVSPQEMARRLRGAAVKGVNEVRRVEKPKTRKQAADSTPAAAAAKPTLARSKPGSIDPFRAMARDVTS